MRIGRLAACCEVSRDTLRFYEARGLIQSRRSANGYRDYRDDTVHLVAFIRTAQQLGFSLNEIGNNVQQLWKAADPGHAVELLLRDKLALIEQRMADLQALRTALLQRLDLACPLRPDLEGASAGLC
nr:MerR family transcriptional regulator [uncultured Pseudomonas sp.]